VEKLTTHMDLIPRKKQVKDLVLEEFEEHFFSKIAPSLREG
jgi:hypothetical protein